LWQMHLLNAVLHAAPAVAVLAQVTYVVVSRNHGTRLFPTTEADSLKGNVMPGTVLDTQLVAPLRFEMFLNTHAGIQVCRPVQILYVHSCMYQCHASRQSGSASQMVLAAAQHCASLCWWPTTMVAPSNDTVHCAEEAHGLTCIASSRLLS
jgi:hypothetical protein